MGLVRDNEYFLETDSALLCIMFERRTSKMVGSGMSKSGQKQASVIRASSTFRSFKPSGTMGGGGQVRFQSTKGRLEEEITELEEPMKFLLVQPKDGFVNLLETIVSVIKKI
ncbi:unnamed protein product, partial [Iphiclides podalirius]